MYNFLNDYFGWDEDFYSFKRNIHDTSPYKIYRKENECVIAHNVLGINQEDLTVEIKGEDSGYYILINGKTADDFTEYSVNSRFTIDIDKYDDASYEIKNGILYITLHKRTLDKPTLKMKRK